MDFAYIKAQLQRRNGERQLSAVARQSNVGLATLRRIIDGKGAGGPQLSTLETLDAYLKRTERQKVLSDEEQA